MHDLGPAFRVKIEKMLNSAIIAGLGKQLTNGELPAGITLSVRTINVTPQKISVRAALGAFGGVVSKLPVTTNPSPSKCFLATAVYGTGSTEVQILRTFRDIYLLTNNFGKKFVALYELMSPPMAKFISNKPVFKTLTRAIIVRPFIWMAKCIMALINK